MKKILFFEIKFCPYCIKAKQFLEELLKENPIYRQIEIEFIDERKEKKRASEYDYYLVPTFYISGQKVHEGSIRTKEEMEDILKQALVE